MPYPIHKINPPSQPWTPPAPTMPSGAGGRSPRELAPSSGVGGGSPANYRMPGMRLPDPYEQAVARSNKLGDLLNWPEGQRQAWVQDYLTKYFNRLGRPENVGFPLGWKPGQPWPNQGGNGGVGGAVHTGIQSATIYNPQQVSQQESQLRQMPQGGAFPGRSGGTLQQMFQDASLASGNRAATDFSRDAALQNAQHELASQQARAQAGIGWGNIQAGQHGQNLGNQSQAIGTLISLLQGFL